MGHGEGQDRDKAFAGGAAVAIRGNRLRGIFIEVHTRDVGGKATGSLRRPAGRRLREERQVSLGTLADIAGVTRRTIQMYLEGMSATMEVAMRLEEFLNESLVVPVDPFALLADPARPEERLPQLEGFEREMFERLERLGYQGPRTLPLPSAPMSANEDTSLPPRLGRV